MNPDLATLLSTLALSLGVLAYGVGGASLAVGSIENPLRSPAWWAGTALQGVGFGLTFLARHQLPLLIVQSAVVAGLAVTAVARAVGGQRRLSTPGWLAVAALVCGIGVLGWATVPGPGRAATWPLVGLLGVLSAVTAALVPMCRRLARVRAAVAHGLLSGVGFGVAAVAARLLMGDPAHPPWRFWELPLTGWAAGVMVAAGLAVGQWHLTLGLARRVPLAALGLMYLAAVVMPALIGWFALAEYTRPGTGPVVAAGLALAALGGFQLLREEGAAEAAVSGPA